MSEFRMAVYTDTPTEPPMLLVSTHADVTAAMSLSGMAACRINMGDWRERPMPTAGMMDVPCCMGSAMSQFQRP
jgi:hypothetical protein